MTLRPRQRRSNECSLSPAGFAERNLRPGMLSVWALSVTAARITACYVLHSDCAGDKQGLQATRGSAFSASMLDTDAPLTCASSCTRVATLVHTPLFREKLLIVTSPTGNSVVVN